MTSAPIHHNLARFFAKHVTDKVTATIAPKSTEGQGDMETPTIQVTPSHVGLLMPKKWVWPVVASVFAGIGGISIVQYLGDKAGFATKEEVAAAKTDITATIKEAVTASQKATQDALNKAVSDAVAPLKAEIETMKSSIQLQFNALDVRATKLERAKAPKETKQ